ncbi:MAG: outer membrane lipoprotein-sorting protein [Candidatus Aminicenantes bacterium]
MKKLLTVLSTALLTWISVFSSLWCEKRPDSQAERIVKKMDELYRSSASQALVEMEIITPHWQRTLKMRVWSKGMEKTFIRILEPKKERGIATLRIGNEMWNYLPKTNKVMKIPPSMMMSSWMGSDLTNDDLVKEFTFLESYHFQMTNVDNPEEGVLYVKCIPKKDLPIVWGYIILAVRQQNYMPLWENYYDEKGKLMRVMRFKEVRVFGDREIPSVMEVIPQTKEGHRTILRYIEARFDVPMDEDVFTLRHLRERI